MQKAGFAENEASRLAALHGLDILDTPPDDRFDRLARITAQTFEMPIALISLVDRDRQWFKSAIGLDIDETPREVSFCGHAILGDDVFEVRNARRDPRFRDNPLVSSAPYIRFYAGAPLKTPDGHKLGTLCIVDSVPRQLSDDEMTKLRNLADLVVAEILKHRNVQARSSDAAAQATTAAEFFDSIPADPGNAVLLFDIDDVLASRDDANSNVSPEEIFAHLLQDHFPNAPIAHIGDYHFCVLLTPDESFDEVRAINRLCSDARKLLCFAEGHDSLTPYVGRIQYGANKYASVDDISCHADRMFSRHERPPAPAKAEVKKFLKEMIGWRKTIF